MNCTLAAMNDIIRHHIHVACSSTCKKDTQRNVKGVLKYDDSQRLKTQYFLSKFM